MTLFTDLPTPVNGQVSTEHPPLLPTTAAEYLHDDLIATQLPAWFKEAPLGVRDALRETLDQWHRTQTVVADVFARMQPIRQFAEQRLQAALAAYGWGHVDPHAYGLKQIRLLQNALIFITNQQLKIVDTLVRQTLPDIVVPESFEIDLISSISQHSLLHAALQNFEGAETQPGGFETGTAIFSLQNNRLIEHPELPPETFAAISRNLNLGEQYQAHLSNLFNPPDDVYEPEDPRSRAYQINASFIANKQHEFIAELHMAYMKGQLSYANYHAILQGVWPGKAGQDVTAGHSTLEVMGFEVPGIMVLWPERTTSRTHSPCVVYLPQSPYKVFNEFQRFDLFKEQLRDWLKTPEFSRYFVQRVPLRHRAQFMQRSDIRHVAWDSLLLLSPQVITESVIMVETRHVDQSGNPFEVAWQLQRAQIMDDARLLAVPTADEDSKSRLKRQVEYLNAGLSVLTLVLGFVPVLGEILLAFSLIQVGLNVFKGIQAWQRNDRLKALDYLFDVAQNLALVAVPAAAKGLRSSPEPVVDKLVRVTLSNGEKRLWKPDLTPYQEDPARLWGLEPDAQGIYSRDDKAYIRLDSAVYRIKADRSTGQGVILHPDDPSAYTPKVRGNSGGQWAHELEDPLRWPRLQLFRRLGPAAEALSDVNAEHVLQITGTSDDILRKVHMDLLPMPALLADCLTRVSLVDQVESFVAHMKAGMDGRAEFAPLQLEVLTRLPSWPADRVLRVVDKRGGIVREYGYLQIASGPRLQIAEAQIRKGDLLKVTLESLSQAQIEHLLGEPVTGLVPQRQALARLIGEAAEAEQAQLVSRLYTLSEKARPELMGIQHALPSLPVRVLEELSSHLTPREAQTLAENGRLPLRILEEGRVYRQMLRLNRALEGLFYPVLSNADSHSLVWHTLPLLRGWSAQSNLELYSTVTGKKLGGVIGDPSGYSAKLYKTENAYEAVDGRSGEAVTDPDLLPVLYKALNLTQRYALDLPLDEGVSVLRSRLCRLAAQQRAASAQGLGMQKIKPWFKSPMRLAEGRLGYPMGGRVGRLPSENDPRLLKDLVHELYPLLSEAETERLLLSFRQPSAQATRELVRRKAELDKLRRVLDDWEASPSWTQSLSGARVKVSTAHKQQMKQAIISAWRRQTPTLTVDNHIGHELNLNGWPVDSLPTLNADFSHVSALHLAHATGGISSTFLENFPGLRVLSLIDNGLTEVPAALSAMPDLIDLNLQGNQIVLSGTTSGILSGLTRLRSLNLTGNPLGRTFSVRQMGNLQHLMLRYTGLSAWPEGVERLTQMRLMDLRNNAITQVPAQVLTPERYAINRVTSLHDNPLDPDSLRRLELYRREHGINFGISAQRQHVAEEGGIYHWAVSPSREQTRQWQALSEHGESGDFFRVLEDLSASSQFTHTRQDLTQRVWKLIGAAHDNQEVRERLFAMAGHQRTCADGIAMVFADMELNYSIFQAESSLNTEQQLLNLARGLFRIEKLNAYVSRVLDDRIIRIMSKQQDYVQRLQVLADEHPGVATRPVSEMAPVDQQGVAYRLGSPEATRLASYLSPLWVQQEVARLDPLEVQMFYQVNLARVLELPARPKSMQFGNVAEVTPQELSVARQYVLQQETQPALQAFIEKQVFWGEYLRKKYPEAFNGMSTNHQNRMDTVYSERGEGTDEEYMEKISTVVESRERAMDLVVSELTRQELEQHPFALAEPRPSTSRDT
ncbi:C-terminal novel E3 ligase, LRR-interacting [Pseudomonas taetrolens]|uniref:RING-type E3 ubiquitin transferase n=1 Tax=Pseudomonas taetrolens TaxID=47884 RepID=A0A1H4RI69_PSETA|nr:NEL-type E3 ubiquitin ligase domain-containing protein [Pseudomonas taetrolens]SEC31526.1 C-terminal novel E3 ligase, LRR-interacting [Pseudomonas taetrolens]SQF86337.1 leucine-rich repeat-containing protein [Pseudomonas taetrolens]VEH49414.1 leucine-rich repeat-containing protein [Pseudomonas taetrolens]